METDLLVVEVETPNGSRYLFPDMPRSTLENAMTLAAWDKVDNIILVNIHAACLSIPKASIVRVVAGDSKEIVWAPSAA